LGGRNIAILSLPPLGCIPAEITLVGRGNPGCVKHLNIIASYFNDQIPGMLADMKKTMPGSRLILIDIFSPIYNACQNPQKYGMSASISSPFSNSHYHHIDIITNLSV
jgi:hypothetical protein